MTQSVIELNGFVLHFSGEQFTANVADVPETTDVRALREQFDEWFLHWSDGRLYGLARVAKPTRTFGVPVRLKCQDHLRLLAARVADVLPQKFPKYEAFRRRPFTFLGLKDEIVASVSEKLKSVPALLSSFEIRPKFELDAKLVELRDGEPFIGLFVQAGTRWEIKAPLHRLAEAGIDLHGMHVVRRNPDEGER